MSTADNIVYTVHFVRPNTFALRKARRCYAKNNILTKMVQFWEEEFGYG